jgi:homogentisate 1,2-dioxygenase
MSRKWIPATRAEGEHSRQAHCDLPADTYEREISKEGFFGPAAFMYHRHPPTAWSSFEGPLRPRAFDLARLEERQQSPWSAPVVLRNAATEVRFWRPAGSMPGLVRNADGDFLLFVHSGRAEFYCDYGHLAVDAGDYLVIPRGTMWRLEPIGQMALLTIEASNTHFTLPDRGLVGPHAVFDPAMLDVPALTSVFVPSSMATAANGRCISRSAAPCRWRPTPTIRWMPSVGTETCFRCVSMCAISGR